ncbi:hypothetical protein ACXHMN_29485 [Rhizobium sp. LEGMi12c]|uniref:Uncharacterized protein n=1 Tax=Rhizobium hainanense TaxID=52131 RepID=A0A1C3VLP4_9HYPH|nr:hypothetical protein GA0061100_106366 [Rhizobium hainanense]
MDTVLYLASLTTQTRRPVGLGSWTIAQLALVGLTLLLSLLLLLRTA